MKRKLLIFILAITSILACFKTTEKKEADKEKSVAADNSQDTTKSEFSVLSTAFKDNQDIPQKYAMKEASGLNLSPQISWINLPEGTKSLALVMFDEHPAANKWIHWLVANIPSSVDSIPEGASPDKISEPAFETNNSFGFEGYGGPQPPKGSGKHKYIFKLFALRVEKIQLSQFATLDNLDAAISDKLIKSTFFSGYYER